MHKDLKSFADLEKYLADERLMMTCGSIGHSTYWARVTPRDDRPGAHTALSHTGIQPVLEAAINQACWAYEAAK